MRKAIWIIGLLLSQPAILYAQGNAVVEPASAMNTAAVCIMDRNTTAAKQTQMMENGAAASRLKLQMAAEERSVSAQVRACNEDQMFKSKSQDRSVKNPPSQPRCANPSTWSRFRTMQNELKTYQLQADKLMREYESLERNLVICERNSITK